jgi:hypothetical protein
VDGQYRREVGRKLGPQIPDSVRKRAKGGGRDARHGGRARVPERAGLRAVNKILAWGHELAPRVQRGRGRGRPAGRGIGQDRCPLVQAVRAQEGDRAAGHLAGRGATRPESPQEERFLALDRAEARVHDAFSMGHAVQRPAILLFEHLGVVRRRDRFQLERRPQHFWVGPAWHKAVVAKALVVHERTTMERQRPPGRQGSGSTTTAV